MDDPAGKATTWIHSKVERS